MAKLPFCFVFTKVLLSFFQLSSLIVALACPASCLRFSDVGQREAKSEGNAVVGFLEGHSVLAHLAQEAIGAHKEVELLGVQVEHHAARDACGGGCTVERNLDGLDGTHIDREHALVPSELASHATCIEEAEAQLVV